jgi:hypothetical protein
MGFFRMAIAPRRAPRHVEDFIRSDGRDALTMRRNPEERPRGSHNYLR